MSNIPVSWDTINAYNSRFSPSTVHCKNTGLVNYFSQRLFEKVVSCYEFDLPEAWPKNFFKYVLFGLGCIGVFDTERYGVVALNCEPTGFNLYYQPLEIIVANPLLGSVRKKIDVDCTLIRLKDDYRSIIPMVSLYADLMALAVETAGTNLLNSKLSYVFAAEGKAQAETFKKLYDQIASGEPAAVIDKKLFREDGSPAWQMFTQDVGRSYITDRILADLKRIEDDFCTAAGIPNANTEKRERLIVDEVNANNDDTESLPRIILENVGEGFDKANAMFGLNCSIRYIGNLDKERRVEDGNTEL
jgi:hypothetical protein